MNITPFIVSRIYSIHFPRIVSVVATILVALTPMLTMASDVMTTAKEVLALSGLNGGIVVHLGCGDGLLTAALGSGKQITVHGLDRDSGKVEQARRHFLELGIYGRVSAESFDDDTLPYTDNLINLLVVQDQGSVSHQEIMRVLTPGGMACVQRDGQWERTKKPRPDNIDSWSHFLHDAGNNAVANDSVVGPPRSLQWLAPPLWLRSHETPSGIQSPVSDGERLFYILDEGIVGVVDKRLPERWALICRDAFNGRLLWKRPLESWGWRDWSYARDADKDWTTMRGRRGVPAENQRRVVATNGRLYTTLSYHAPLSILDPATGSVIATVKQTEGTREILVHDGVAVAYVCNLKGDFNRKRGVAKKSDCKLVGVDGKTGDVLWEVVTGAIRPLTLAIGDAQVIYLAGKDLIALDLKKGQQLWEVRVKRNRPRAVVVSDGVIVMQGGKFVDAFAIEDGRSLWEKSVNPIGGAEGADLFVIDGLVWRGMETVDDQSNPVGRSSNARVVGWDLRTGVEKKHVFVKNLRSPEHHHRCYRNKATTRFLISSLEGAEFLDFQANDHSQENWLRGSCGSGMIPCNGMLYVPPDQCFCQPGAKLLGYAAIKSQPASRVTPVTVSDASRLTKGPAFGAVPRRVEVAQGDWPTYRHDASRSGTTQQTVPSDLAATWQAELGGRLTAPVVASGRVFVASIDAHTLFALNAEDGKRLWNFTANGRIDSAPTVHQGLVLFGSSDGHAYCVRASDGELVWRFLAAPYDQRVAYFDQIESTWPVHGSLLVEEGIVYCTAGRSTYLDGGIRIYGLEPATGRIVHQGLLEGPFPDIHGTRDVGFFSRGANSDLLVSEGGFLYMRQKKLTLDLKEVAVEVLSSKGAQDVGLHVFSTSGFLDDSWYNRTFWMYSKRWPGFQLANQAPKTGQLLVVDQKNTYAVRVFYRRNVHSPMFFPGKEGYLLFADRNENEPQIVGEATARTPVRWLPQSDYSRARGDEMRSLNSEAYGLDKMIGYTRAEPPIWKLWLPVRIRAMVKAGDTLFVAGAADEFDESDPYALFDRPHGSRVVAVSAADGRQIAETSLESAPVFDGLIAAGGRLFVSLKGGSVVCLSEVDKQ